MPPAPSTGTTAAVASVRVADPTISSPGRMRSGACSATLMAAAAYWNCGGREGSMSAVQSTAFIVRPTSPESPFQARSWVIPLSLWGSSGCQGERQLSKSSFPSARGAAVFPAAAVPGAFSPRNRPPSPRDETFRKSALDMVLFLLFSLMV